MKRFIVVFLFAAICSYGFSTTWTIVNSGFAFSPATLTIQQGDNVNFVLESIHDAVEVSQSVWNANGNSPEIGFSVVFGGGSVSAAELTPGTHYYVCSPHASSGMKGRIIVQPISGLRENEAVNDIQLYPNPVVNELNVRFDLSGSYLLEVKLFDLQGKLANVLFAKNQVAGPFLQTFDLAGKAAPGMYLVKMTLGEKSTFRKIVIM